MPGFKIFNKATKGLSIGQLHDGDAQEMLLFIKRVEHQGIKHGFITICQPRKLLLRKIVSNANRF